MRRKRHAHEFKIEAVKPLTERGHPVADVAARLGVARHGLPDSHRLPFIRH